ncbi:major histocompatibility complex class I-related gene protein-like [Cololabis saira]|uniref:major histocompatibility complex class I-related gene protein-like n=1 Tax=Cololabis saira TaxID=129043 RepID=UPI002AD5B28F|nr:major histocompatibility complex class I-related gene protein-like [Cololabis saira]
MIGENRKDWDRLIWECRECKDMFKAETESYNQHTSKTEGAHIIQQIIHCEQDDETNTFEGYVRYGNNGEDFIAFDVKTETWITLVPEAETVKQEWDGNEVRNKFWKNIVTGLCSTWLNKSLTYGKSYLNRKDLPSASLLQENSSSPVTCHATGFYPDRADMFWRRDGEQIHEGVKHGDILPNQDESFQMIVDLDVSSVPSEDWMRYDCVFQLSGVPNVIIMKLDKDVIKSNRRKALTGNESNEKKVHF